MLDGNIFKARKFAESWVTKCSSEKFKMSFEFSNLSKLVTKFFCTLRNHNLRAMLI